ncbi:MAG TPA: ArdC family protein [Candidatus Angelobacter sp.]|nr:ArdC family protein [Candidatus Angelobacter sp.]
MLSRNEGKTGQELIQASINALVKALEAGQSDALTSYLKAMGRFHDYSLNNILLIAAQKPTATRVAGLRTWNTLGRRVKRGEKGILIFAPLIGRKRTDESTERQLLGFRGVYVFDVSQTNGDPLPELNDTIEGDVSEILPRLIDFVASQQIKLEYSNQITPARGISCGGSIRLLPDMSPTETLSTLIHELAHEMLHKAERRTTTTKAVKGTEAEAVAFVVCHALGLQTGTGSADYIQLYHGDAKLLQESLGMVQQAVAQILEGISPKEEEISAPIIATVNQAAVQEARQ